VPGKTQSDRVGAPIAESSLMVWAAERYPSHCLAMKTVIATCRSDERMPPPSHVFRSMGISSLDPPEFDVAHEPLRHVVDVREPVGV
jgi:hypothetical protein